MLNQVENTYFVVGTDREGFSVMFQEVHPEALLGWDFLLTESEFEEVFNLCQEKEVEYYEDLCDLCKECFDVDLVTSKVTKKESAKDWKKRF